MNQLILVLSILIQLTTLSHGQRTCGSELDWEEMKRENPQRYQRFMDLEEFTKRYIKQKQSLIRSHGGLHITIPVVVHILHNGEPIGTGLNISMTQIQSQIDVLNEDFRRQNADANNTPNEFIGVAADVGIEFRLACINPDGNPTNGVIRKYSTATTWQALSDGIKFEPFGSQAWPADQYLNIWVGNRIEFNGEEIAGYAQYPADLISSPETDGVVVRTVSFGRTGNVQVPFDKGRTATHEVGHWLNLIHINGDYDFCSINDPQYTDRVADTPEQLDQYFGCPTHPQTSCSSHDMFMNYMDFTDDDCMNIFTEGQADRMLALFEPNGIRESFNDCTLMVDVCENPPNITGSDIICQGSGYNLTLNEVPTGNTVEWETIPAGLFSTSSGTGTVASLSANSSYTSGSGQIRFTIENTCGHTALYSKDIQVGPPHSDDINIIQIGQFYPGGTEICADQSNNAIALWDGEGAITEYSWYTGNWSIQNYPLYPDYTDPMQSVLISAFTTPYDDPVGIQVRAKNTCGWGTYGEPVILDAIDCSGYRIVLSPNPASTEVTVSIKDEKGIAPQNIEAHYEVNIVNTEGKLAYHSTKTAHKFSISLAGLEPGIYIVRVSEVNKVYSGILRVE
ncbi:MAG TPA: M43 family zinc metalloprotease [Membranihabitans sp.]|nr:M43 family zinc metalloprotease [Membranihabitans sp.]